MRVGLVHSGFDDRSWDNYLGVMFSVPLRRALVTGSDLPYAEGVAAAEVRKVGSGTVVGSLVAIAGLLWWFIAGGPIAADAPVVIGATLVYMLVIGAIIAAVCGYMAGLIGASNSPVSGVGILAVPGAAVLLSLFYGTNPDKAQALTAYALFTTAIVFSIATISKHASAIFAQPRLKIRARPPACDQHAFMAPIRQATA